jgi:ribosomal-protein-alanine N-acetyltransferase
MNAVPLRQRAALQPLPITSARLELRLLAPQDAQLYFALYMDPQTMRFIAPPLTAQQAARSFRAALRSSAAMRGGPLFFTIVERASQHTIGLCAIQQITPVSAETGVIISAAARGRGIAAESLRAVIGWALATLAVEHVWVSVAAGNHTAERVTRAVGLVRQVVHPEPPPCSALASREVIWYTDRNSWPGQPYNQGPCKPGPCKQGED